METKIAELVHQISSFNHTWKYARQRWGEHGPLPAILRERKSSLQVLLVRDYRDFVYLKHHKDKDDGEQLYSIMLKKPLRLANNILRYDADHIPVRLANELLNETEIQNLLINKEKRL